LTVVAPDEQVPRAVNSPRQILAASLIGKAIEFFDFYIYATAAGLVFPSQFFPASDPATATLASLATFAIAFLARPIGSALFGHFGDRVGRKTTLVAALLTMGLSTVTIGLLPTYAAIGIAAPLLLALCRFGQGLGLGGEWGGAVLLAVENAPPGKRAWYGMFPQLGAPIGFFFSGGVFLLLSRLVNDEQFFSFGWHLQGYYSMIPVAMLTDKELGWLHGPQVDIHPPAPFRTGLIYDETREARRWIHPSLPDWQIEPAQAPHDFHWDLHGWNRLRLVCQGTRVDTWLNGHGCDYLTTAHEARYWDYSTGFRCCADWPRGLLQAGVSANAKNSRKQKRLNLRNSSNSMKVFMSPKRKAAKSGK
jgi:hypothetical protein